MRKGSLAANWQALKGFVRKKISSAKSSEYVTMRSILHFTKDSRSQGDEEETNDGKYEDLRRGRGVGRSHAGYACPGHIFGGSFAET